MSDAPLTLKNFLCSDLSKPVSEGLDLGPIMPTIMAATAALPSDVGSQVTGALRTAMDEVLNVGMGDVLAAAWGKVAALRDAILATRKDVTLVAIVPLLAHKLSTKHAPHIDLTYGPKSLVTVKFDIALNLALKGVVLEIREGRIVGVKGGTCQGDGAMSFLGKPLLQYKSREFQLPGRLSFVPPEEKGRGLSREPA